MSEVWRAINGIQVRLDRLFQKVEKINAHIMHNLLVPALFVAEFVFVMGSSLV